ncbi:MAG: hypothetical protein R3F15_15600 [Lysobacterales bacterium]
MRLLRCALTTLTLVHASLALAGQDPLQVFPDQLHREGPLLILLTDEWPDGCGGRVDVVVSAAAIDLLATSTTAEVCIDSLASLYELIDPLAETPGLVLNDTVTLRYQMNGELRHSRELSFSDQSNHTIKLQTGSWASNLENHGLFLDRQGDVLTAALLDYDADGRAAWSYAVGRIDGNAYSADMVRYGEIECVTTPCSRAAPVLTGRINLVFTFENLLIASYDSVIESPLAQLYGTMQYRRLDFQRSANLPPLDPNRVSVPDLEGVWLAGVQGAGTMDDDFGIVTIRYAGSDSPPDVDGLHLFEAFAGQDLDGQTPPPEGLRFAILCGQSLVECRLLPLRIGRWQRVLRGLFPRGGRWR